MANNSEPLVWLRYESMKNGKKIKIKIQQMTEDLFDEAIIHMTEYFLKREPISTYSKISSDELSIQSCSKLWRSVMLKGMALVAVLDDGDNDIPTMIGANMTFISNKNGKEDLEGCQGECFERIMKTIHTITAEGNIYEKYGVDKYLDACGLSVHPDFHGLGVGLKLLESREYVCKHFGLKMTATVFTAPASQHLAKKNGFHGIIEHEYKTYSIDGEVLYPKLDGKISLMAKVYD